MRELKEDIVKRVWSETDQSKIGRIMPIIAPKKDFEKRNLRVAVYCRVSTDGISQTLSFNLQKKNYIKYVRSNKNWRLVALYSDEGKSATTTRKRVGLQMMLDDAKAGKIDLIVTKSISRLCRNLGDTVRIIRELRALEKPVAIYFETEKMDTLNPNMELIVNVLAIVAEEESKKKSEAITSSYRQRYEDGMFTVPDSFGYIRTGINMIDIDHEEARSIELIYDMYLTGYSPGEIANTLIMLSRKKHTHICLDGTVKEGDINWTAESVLRVFDNEKKCGDVLAQKTYTVDVLEHTTRRNLRNVMQYYAIDQHPAIISREKFYLARKIKSADKNGMGLALYRLSTYVSGALRGYVLTVPSWKGFDIEDYISASLGGYDADMDTRSSIYPEYVLNVLNGVDSKEEVREESDVEHYYEVTKEEFEKDPEISNSEKEIIKTDEIQCYAENEILHKLIPDIKKSYKQRYLPISNRMFFSGNKPMTLIDRNGFKCNMMCYKSICGNAECREIEVLMNLIEKRFIIKRASDIDDRSRLKWVDIRDGKTVMRRCPAPAFTDVIYKYMKWDKRIRYRLYGEIITIGDERCIFFSLDDPAVIIKIKQPGKDERTENETIEISIENSSEYCDERSDEDNYSGEDILTEHGDNKSKAVIFKDRESDKIQSEACTEEIKYSMDYIREHLEQGKEPIEGWGYLDGLLKRRNNCYELLSLNGSEGMCCFANMRMDISTEEESIKQDFGWTLEYTYPSRKAVERKISLMKVEKEG